MVCIRRSVKRCMPRITATIIITILINKAKMSREEGRSSRNQA